MARKQYIETVYWKTIDSQPTERYYFQASKTKRKTTATYSKVGHCNLPERFAPATMPVTAGKKTANTVKKLWPSP
jgi:hypothetical protein